MLGTTFILITLSTTVPSDRVLVRGLASIATAKMLSFGSRCSSQAAKNFSRFSRPLC